MENCVAITGIGVINPLGLGKEAFVEALLAGKSAIQPITRFDASGLPVQVAGQLNDFAAKSYVPRRLAAKMDRFAHYAVAASKLALEDANLSLEDSDPYRVGVWFGNNAGGWDICERGLFELYRDGAAYVNPWQATAWFPTSPQGYVSIANGIKGMCKSFICDRASSASALYFAAQAILEGECDIILAGGTEAPLTRFGMICYTETGVLAESIDDLSVYRPFSASRSGTVLGEGSTVLILEKLAHAKARNANIIGKLYLGSMATDVDVVQSKHYQRTQVKALQKAGLCSTDIDVIYPEAAGTRLDDQVEAEAIANTFAAHPSVQVTCPKASFGHLYGASMATDIAAGLLSAVKGMVPPTIHSDVASDDCPINLVTSSTQKNTQHMLFSSRAREGTSVSMVVSRS